MKDYDLPPCMQNSQTCFRAIALSRALSVEEFWGVNEDLTRFSKGKPLTYLMYGNI